jgi:hypothetical protein
MLALARRNTYRSNRRAKERYPETGSYFRVLVFLAIPARVGNDATIPQPPHQAVRALLAERISDPPSNGLEGESAQRKSVGFRIGSQSCARSEHMTHNVESDLAAPIPERSSLLPR